MQIMAIHRKICGHIRRGRVLHEFGIERTADAHGGIAVLENQFRQRQRGLFHPVRPQAGNDIDHRRGARLQPAGEFQIPAGRRNPHRPRLPAFRELRVLIGEENRFQCFERSRVRFALHLKIRHAVRPHKGPGVLDLRIRIRFRAAEPHIIIHAVGQIVIHVRVGEITVGAEISERIVRHQLVRGDVEQRIGRRVRRQADRVALIARAENRQHEVAGRVPAPLAEGLAEIRVRLRDFPFRAHIEQAQHAHGAVAQEARGLIMGALPFFLEQVVDQPARVSEVPAEIADAGPHRFHDEEPVDPARRLDDPDHEALVKTPHHPVERFDGVGHRGGQHHLRGVRGHGVRRRERGRRRTLPGGRKREAQEQSQRQ